MKKGKVIILGMLALALVFGFVFASCDNGYLDPASEKGQLNSAKAKLDNASYGVSLTDEEWSLRSEFFNWWEKESAAEKAVFAALFEAEGWDKDPSKWDTATWKAALEYYKAMNDKESGSGEDKF